MPRFEGHYQPHLPADLGFYDLRLPETLRAQAALAARYGIAGFCFHWYWFDGRRLLERPLDNLLASPDIDLPFFVNWANENWTRRWDGRADDVLVRQKYGIDDDLAIADAFLALVRDPRYVRIDGRPVLMLYRPSELPDAAATIARWRQRFREHGEQDPYVLMPLVFEQRDPRAYGIDAAVQFPPQHGALRLAHPRDWLRVFDRSFTGALYEYRKLADRMADAPRPDFPLFRSVCPGWDNEARTPNAGHTLIESTPRRYGHWLARSLRATLAEHAPSSRVMFVNAWNEWAEGAHLEPDAHYGHAWLRETCRALEAARDPTRLAAFIADRATEPPVRRRFTDRARRVVVRLGRRLGRKLGLPT